MAIRSNAGSSHRPLKIAVVAPLFESVPPQLYGGTERVVSFLTEELVRQGHAVTLFASGDSVTNGRLHACTQRSLRLGIDCSDPVVPQLAHILQTQEVSRQAQQFDVIHFHVDHVHLPFFAGRDLPMVSTLHGRLDLPLLPELYGLFNDMPLVSISDAQRRPLASAHWVATVYHGLPEDLLAFNPTPGSYLAFLGRISKEKRADLAIRIARRAGVPLKIAAKVDPADAVYYNECIRPLLEESGVEFIGEIGDEEKAEFLGGALATLFPIDWPEPFGLVMIESLACGTPVIAFRRGSVGEILDNGVSGFVVDDEDEAVAAVGRLGSIDRRRCRSEFERRFSVRRMARDYVSVYRTISSAHPNLNELAPEPAEAFQIVPYAQPHAMRGGAAPLKQMP